MDTVELEAQETWFEQAVELDPYIFKANDIRGVVGTQLTPTRVAFVGLSFGSLMRDNQLNQVVVGRDGRLSSPELHQALLKGLLQSGVEVIDIGLVPSPVLYFATHALNTGTGIMITGSHNPAQYNGLKMMLGGNTLTQDQILGLKHKINTQAWSFGQGQVTSACVLKQYQEEITSQITLSKPLKIVVDCGHATAAVVAEALYTAIGAQVIPLYCHIDGHFPAHHPDPSQVHNLQDLIHAVQEHKADCGLAFDGDADRLGVITPEGDIIWPDRQLMLYAEQVLKTHEKASIVYDVKCSQSLETWIQQRNGVPVMHNTGHALIKQKMKELNAPLAGEMSGHFFFHDRWYGFDDALYTGARLLELLSQTSESSSQVFAKLPNTVNTPELQIHIEDSEKFHLIEQLKALNPFPQAKAVTIDGLRVEFNDGWGLVRASNTSPCLVLRFEAKTKERLDSIKEAFKHALWQIKPQLQIDF